MDSQNYKSRGYGSRYRNRSRSNEPPVRRRSAYSPSPPARSYRGRLDNDRDSRTGFDSRRRDGRRFSRYDSRGSSPPRHRRRSGGSGDESSPPRRRNRDYRDSAGGFRPRLNETPRPGSSEVGNSTGRIPTSTPQESLASSVGEGGGQAHSYTNGPVTNATPTPYTQQGYYHPPTAEQNHIPLPHQGMTNHFPPPGAPPPHFYHQHQNNVTRMENPAGGRSGAQGISSRNNEPDEDVIKKILDNLKATGVVDKFRKTFLEECDAKPDFIKLSDRVMGTVESFLNTRTWVPELNRNTERQLVRRRVLESSYFAKELEKMLDQCFIEAESYFIPAIEDCVFSYLGIEKPKKEVVEGQEEKEDKVEEGQADDEESNEAEADEESLSSQASSMDVDSTEDESEGEEEPIRMPPLPREMPLPPPPPQLGGLGLRSFFASLIPGQLGPMHSFLPPTSIAHLVPNHPPPPPLPRPLGLEGRHIPILSNTIITRNVVEAPPLPPTDDEDDEPPPPPSQESTDVENSDSESEELSVGDRSPIMPGGQSPEPDSEEESPPPLPPGDEDNESQSQNPSSPSPVKIPYELPREIPLSPPRPPPLQPKVMLTRRESSESQESPQPPPPGEEEVELPLSYFSLERRVTPENTEVPKEEADWAETEEEIPLPVEAPLPIPVEHEPEIPLPPDAEMEDGEIEEIPLPIEAGQDIQGIAIATGESNWEIPLPIYTREVEVDEEIPLPDEEVEGIPLPPRQNDENNRPTSSHSEIPLPPSLDIPLPPDDLYVRPPSVTGDLSPVTPGELDIWDDSLSEIPLPPTPPTPSTNQMELVPSSPPPLPLEIDLPPAPLEEEAEVSSTMEIEEDPCPPGTESPSEDLIQMPPPPPPPAIPPNDPINLDVMAAVGPGILPDEPLGGHDAVDDDDEMELESPAFETFGETSPPRIDKVEEESFENLIHNVSPQKLFPPPPPLRDSSPPLLLIDEKDKGDDVRVKEADTKRESSSSRRHSSTGSSSSKSHRKSSESHRRHSSSSSSHSTSKSEKKEGEKSDSHRHRSHKRSHGDKEKSGDKIPGSSSSTSSKRESRGEGHGSSSGKKKKRDKDKDKERHSKSHSTRKNSETGTPHLPPVSSSSAIEVCPPKQPPEVTFAEEKAVAVGSRLIDGEWLEPVRWLDVIPSLEMKMRYYSKYTDPLLMDEEVSLDSVE